jgi:porphobilinogen synthase
MRRNRSDRWIRDLVSEHSLSVHDLVQPLFVIEGENKKEAITTLPGIYRFSIDKLLKEIEQIAKLGIPAIAIFPYVNKELKTAGCEESFNPDNLICRTLRSVKQHFPEIGLIADVALDPYNEHGHDGLVSGNKILNDETIELLVKQSLVQADSGADIIAPSDMMDGRVRRIREALEDHNFQDTKILAYTAKYASSLYGPFRDAIGSSGNLLGDKQTYQMDFTNSGEAVLEAGLDINEGADMLMVKPATFYLDIIAKIKQKHSLPIFAFQVSGEFAMMKYAKENGIVSNYEDLLYESLIACKRAGSSAILSYGACDIARKLSDY